jgi:7-cyano-7-deazaguanine synthase
MNNKPVVVLHSGGQDSTTCLAWAIQEFGRDDLYTVGFDYGQRHSIELHCAAQIHTLLGLKNEHRVFNLDVLKGLAGGALTNPDIDVELNTSESSQNEFAHKHGLPSTFVPGRNVLFLGVAAAYGAQKGIYTLVTGVCEEDRSGYPDCREEFIESMTDTLSAALDDKVIIRAPLLHRSKAETWAWADELGVLDLVREYTHTCYHGNHRVEDRHEWGYGCGVCPACIERKEGYEKFITDKLMDKVS